MKNSEVKRGIKNPDIKLALKIFYTMPEIGTSEIEDLFGVKETKASNMKKEVKKLMVEKGVKSFRPYSINTKIAYEIWGLNVEEMEKSLKKLQRLGVEV